MKKFAPIVLVAGLALTGCSASAEPSIDSSLCVDVPAKLQKEIASEASGVAIKPVKASAFKSEEYPSAYLVAMEFSAAGGGNEVGVWSTSDLAGGSPVYSVDGIAKSFTGWKKSVDSKVPLDSTSKGVSESKACLAK